MEPTDYRLQFQISKMYRSTKPIKTLRLIFFVSEQEYWSEWNSGSHREAISLHNTFLLHALHSTHKTTFKFSMIEIACLWHIIIVCRALSVCLTSFAGWLVLNGAIQWPLLTQHSTGVTLVITLGVNGDNEWHISHSSKGKSMNKALEMQMRWDGGDILHLPMGTISVPKDYYIYCISVGHYRRSLCLYIHSIACTQ
jgi:hypothetical protein